MHCDRDSRIYCDGVLLPCDLSSSVECMCVVLGSTTACCCDWILETIYRLFFYLIFLNKIWGLSVWNVCHIWFNHLDAPPFTPSFPSVYQNVQWPSEYFQVLAFTLSCFFHKKYSNKILQSSSSSSYPAPALITLSFLLLVFSSSSLSSFQCVLLPLHCLMFKSKTQKFFFFSFFFFTRGFCMFCATVVGAQWRCPYVCLQKQRLYNNYIII